MRAGSNLYRYLLSGVSNLTTAIYADGGGGGWTRIEVRSNLKQPYCRHIRSLGWAIQVEITRSVYCSYPIWYGVVVLD